jgi:hypothetical protein
VVRRTDAPHRTVDVSETSPEDEQEGPVSVPDDQLPEDLQPGEDNPLAQPADDDVPEDVLKDTAGGSGGGSEEADRGGDDAPDESAASSETESHT